MSILVAKASALIAVGNIIKDYPRKRRAKEQMLILNED